MKTFEDIHAIWQRESEEKLPGPQQIRKIVKTFQTKRRFVLFLLILAILLCFVLIVIIYVHQKAELWTTKTGEVLIVVGFFLTLYLKLRSFQKEKLSALKKVPDYLDELKTRIDARVRISGMQMVVLHLYTIGFGLYIYEDVRHSLVSLVGSYIGILIYIALVLFLFRPWMNKLSKRKKKMLLEKIESIKRQVLE